MTYGLQVGHPAIPRYTVGQPGRGKHVRVCHRRRALANDDVAARGFQLGSQRRRSKSPAGSRRRRHVLRPYSIVWLSNQYVNTGIDFTRLSITYRAANAVTFVPDPNNQPRNVGGAATNEIDVIDPDYRVPVDCPGEPGVPPGAWLLGPGRHGRSALLEDARGRKVQRSQSRADVDRARRAARLLTAIPDAVERAAAHEYDAGGKIAGSRVRSNAPSATAGLRAVRICMATLTPSRMGRTARRFRPGPTSTRSTPAIRRSPDRTSRWVIASR